MGLSPDEEKFLFLLKYFQAKVLSFVVEKERFASLPKLLQSHASFANETLLEEVGLPLDLADKEVFLFSGEATLYPGIDYLKQNEKYARRGLSTIMAPPSLIMAQVSRTKPAAIYFDYGSEHELKIGEERFSDLMRIDAISQVSQLAQIFIAQAKDGMALSMKIENKNYALAFIDEIQGSKALQHLIREHEGATLEANRLKTVADNILKSHFAGVVINPTLGSQVILKKSDLKRLALAIETQGVMWQVKKLFR